MEKYIYIYGTNPVLEGLLNPNLKINGLYLLARTSDTEKYLMLANKRGVKVYYVEKPFLFELVKGDKHQNIVLEVETPKNYTIAELATISLQKKNPFLLLLDQLSDPHNLGAILRTCDMFNVDGVIILDRRQVGITATVAKTSAGAFMYVPLCIVNNLTNAIDFLKGKGFWIYATSLTSSAQKVQDLKYDVPICIIVGSEGNGVSHKLLSHSDFNIYIPTKGHIDSLNVSVATAILVYQIKLLQEEI